MIARLQKLWSDINASYWFFPGLFAISTLLLAMLTVELDRRGLTEWVDHLNWLPPARPQGASNMLTVIASSMIGVASTVFSITIAAVAYASGNYGPRLLTNFMEDRGNQLSLATFIGTFVYAITVLLSVRMPDESGVLTSQGDGFVPQLSLLIAYVLMAVSVMVLVYFLNHVPSSIRINAVLEGIGRRLLNAIRDNFDEPMKARVEGEVREGTPVFASRTGYIQVINWNELLKVARKSGSELQLAVRTGDFCHPSVAIGYWSEKPDDACDEQVRECIALGDARTPAQDLHFMIDELVEIGLRALSPGINDPGTAIDVLHRLSRILSEADPTRGIPAEFPRIEVPVLRAGDLIEDGFAALIRAGAGHPEVVGVAVSELAQLEQSEWDELAMAARSMRGYALRHAKHALEISDDRRDLARRS